MSDPAGASTGDRPSVVADRYELRALLGEGGMGSVYLAWDRDLSEQVALKTLKPHHGRQSQAAERLRAEVKLARKVTHRNVARTYDLGAHDGIPFLTMEYVEGEDLSLTAERRDALTLERLLALAVPVCEGLAAAHEVGVIHRDLKPSNIIVGRDGRVVLTDFGIARAVRSDGRLTAEQDILGTPAYMAPEQVLGEQDIDHRADIYSLGVLLFELWSRRLPFDGPTAMAVAMARLHRDAPVLPDAPDGLATLVARCLARERDERFASAQDIVASLELIRSGAGVPSAPRPSGGLSIFGRSARTETLDAIPGAGRRLTVAVLPIRHGGSEEDAFTAEGLTEDLIDALSTNANLWVRPHGAVLQYTDPGRDLGKIGRELGVQSVVDGSLRRSGDRLRARVAVVSTNDGFQIWAGRFDARASELFDVSEKAATGISQALANGKLETPASVQAVSTEAVDLYLRARQHMSTAWFGDLGPALTLLDRALELAPDDGRILAAAAIVRARSSFSNFEEGSDHLTVAERLAHRALDVAPGRPDPHIALGRIHYERMEALKSVEALERAVRIAPSNDQAHEMLGRVLREVGPLGRAMSHIRTAIALSPQSIGAIHDLTMCLAMEGRWDDVDNMLTPVPDNADVKMAREAERARIDLWRPTPRWAPDKLPESPPAGVIPLSTWFRQELLLTGRISVEHEAWLNTGLQLTARTSRFRMLVNQFRMEAFLKAGQHDRALRDLDSALDDGLFDLVWLTHCPLWTPVAQDPRYIRATDRLRTTLGQV